MGRSSHKDRKRRSSSSRGRLTVLEEKMARVINILTSKEVRRSRSPSPSWPSSPVRGHQEAQASGLETESGNSNREVAQGREKLAPCFGSGYSLAAPARQEGPGDPQLSGAYFTSGAVFGEYRRKWS